MQLIPVIDIRDGKAVAARGGRREDYQLLETPYAKTADPVAVVRGLYDAFGFETFYVADLDGIERKEPNTRVYDAICDVVPDSTIWLDNGYTRTSPQPKISAIIGSESLADVQSYQEIVLRDSVPPILSLDFTTDGFLGPRELVMMAGLWPRDVIVMTMARVGMSDGPDLQRLRDIVTLGGPRHQFFAAGGIRGLDDLRAARNAGAYGALVATALHAGKIKPGDLEKVSGL